VTEESSEDDTVVIEPALNQYIDLETYDVVTGERHRKVVKELQVENAELRVRLRAALDHIDRFQQAQLEPWPMPQRTADPIPPDTWGD